MRLTRDGALVAVAGAVTTASAMASGHHELLAVGTGLGLAILLAGVTAVAAGGGAVLGLAVPDRATDADPVALAVSVGTGRRSCRRCQMLIPVDGRDTGRLPVPAMAAGSRLALTGDLPGLRRGRHVVGPARVVVMDPFGLVTSSCSGGPAREILVHPRRHPMTAGEPGDPPLPGRGASRPGGHPEELDRLRDHAPGDDARLIHWPASLRLDRLVVRDRAPVTARHAVVLLDVRPEAYDHAGRFEDAVRVVASLLDAHRRGGRATEIHTTAGALATVTGGGRGYLDALDRLAEVALAPSGGGPTPPRPGVGGPRRPTHVVTGTAATGPGLTDPGGTVAVLALGSGPAAGAGVLAARSAEALVRRWNGRIGR